LSTITPYYLLVQLTFADSIHNVAVSISSTLRYETTKLHATIQYDVLPMIHISLYISYTYSSSSVSFGFLWIRDTIDIWQNSKADCEKLARNQSAFDRYFRMLLCFPTTKATHILTCTLTKQNEESSSNTNSSSNE